MIILGVILILSNTPKKISFLNLNREHKSLQSEILASLKKTFLSSDYINSSSLHSFENEFSKYCGGNHTLGVGSGLDALVMLLKAHDIGPGDEVIVPAHTFIATWLAVSHVGATPVAVDVDEESFNINVNLISNAITKNTKAVIAVHLYGQPADLDSIIKLCKQKELFLFEDAAQAHGAFYNGQRIGAVKTDGCAFSFYPTKNLGAIGDGGSITTRKKSIYNRIKRLRNYGSIEKYKHEIIGYNSRLDEIQASILSINLKKLDEWNRQRQQVAKRYLNEVKNKKIKLPKQTSESHVWHLFVIRVKNRDKLIKYLQENNIQTSIHYPKPPYLQLSYSKNHKDIFPVTTKLSNEILSLPMDPFFYKDEVSKVIKVLNQFS